MILGSVVYSDFGEKTNDCLRCVGLCFLYPTRCHRAVALSCGSRASVPAIVGSLSFWWISWSSSAALFRHSFGVLQEARLHYLWDCESCVWEGICARKVIRRLWAQNLCLSKLFYYMNLFHISERKIVQVRLVFLFQLMVQVTEPNHSGCRHLSVGFAFIKIPNMMSRCSEGHTCSPFAHSNKSMVPVNQFLTMWNVEEFRIHIMETLNVLVRYVQQKFFLPFIS